MFFGPPYRTTMCILFNYSIDNIRIIPYFYENSLMFLIGDLCFWSCKMLINKPWPRDEIGRLKIQCLKNTLLSNSIILNSSQNSDSTIEMKLLHSGKYAENNTYSFLFIDFYFSIHWFFHILIMFFFVSESDTTVFRLQFLKKVIFWFQHTHTQKYILIAPHMKTPENKHYFTDNRTNRIQWGICLQKKKIGFELNGGVGSIWIIFFSFHSISLNKW